MGDTSKHNNSFKRTAAQKFESTDVVADGCRLMQTLDTTGIHRQLNV